MASVETVRGPVDSGALGGTLMHEHVFVFTPEFRENYPELIGWDEEARLEDATNRLRDVKNAGIDTFVDLTVIGMGRDVSRLQKLNESVDLNIIVATGMYTYDELPWHLKFPLPDGAPAAPDPMVRMFVRDITRGIADTGIKAAILKCCTDRPGVTPGVERVLRSVALAHRETGAPISTHTDSRTHRGLEQQDIFASEGVDLTRVVIGHSGDTDDYDYLKAMLDRGSYLGMDRFGYYGPGTLTFAERVGVVAELCELGYARQLVLSHDLQCWLDWVPGEIPPDRNFTHISTKVLPALRERGVREGDIDLMIRQNPARIFG